MGNHYIQEMTAKHYCNFRFSNPEKTIYIPKTSVEIVLEANSINISPNPQRFITWK
jgi:hypothetical protein